MNFIKILVKIPCSSIYPGFTVCNSAKHFEGDWLLHCYTQNTTLSDIVISGLGCIALHGIVLDGHVCINRMVTLAAEENI